MATSCTFDKADVRDLPEKPYQPGLNFKFPARSFGISKPVNRSFQPGWFQRFGWIHYDAVSDCALCFSCCKAARQGKVRLTGLAEQTFLIKGFTNWKDATRVLSKHETSDFHKQAVAAMANKADVGVMLSSQLAREASKLWVLTQCNVHHTSSSTSTERGWGQERLQFLSIACIT